jgi:carbamoyl-phosphate synthase small subunit
VFTSTKSDFLVVGDYIYEGNVVGLKDPTGFEVCFNTSMTGYQEIMTDPSYLGQVVVFTSTHIGNTGCNSVDLESNLCVKGIICRERPTIASNYRGELDFEKWCVEHNAFIFYGIDTRDLVEKIRNKEVGTGVVAHNLEDALMVNQKQFDTESQDLASLACGNEVRIISGKGKRIAVIDCGIKENIVNCLKQQDFSLVIYPCKVVKEYLEEILSADGLVLSNGPGDPRATFNNVSDLDRVVKGFATSGKPILGICLGHQILSIIYGIEVGRMPQGHRGGNQPVIDVNGKVHITSQNHGFCAYKSDLADERYISLFDGVIEGWNFRDKKIISVQYHPEASPGPRDSRYMFEEFKKMF